MTLVFVWAELSKRPELSLRGFCPIVFRKQISGGLEYKEGISSEPLFVSQKLKIKELEHFGVLFDESFSFTVDLANIGYEEIVVHEYVVKIDGKRQTPVPLWSIPGEDRYG